MKILVLNSGSSSLKYQVIDTETGEMLVKGYYERIGQVGAFLTHKVNGEKHHFEHPAKNHEKALPDDPGYDFGCHATDGSESNRCRR